MPSSTQTAQSNEWPEGVIARYLTVGGATVDLTYNEATAVIRSECGAELCHWSNHTDTEGRLDDTPEQAKARFDEWLPIARRRAQEHAEKCRAMSRPTT